VKVVVFEGTNAAGKSEITSRVRNALHASGQPCVCVDPAGYGRIGRILRQHLVDPAISTTPDYDAVLFAALRAEGAMTLQRKSGMETHGLILLERWSIALAAYGRADGASETLIVELRKLLQSVLAVDLTILLDVNGVTAFERAGSAGARNRFEARGADYLDSVASHYRQIAIEEQQTVVVNAMADVETTSALVFAALAKKWDDLEIRSCAR
jgi:dTMP kinase